MTVGGEPLDPAGNRSAAEATLLVGTQFTIKKRKNLNSEFTIKQQETFNLSLVVRTL